MNNTLVSIIMPAYNSELYIADSIESVVKQSYHNWELIIVDDGSTDKTKEIIKCHQEKDNRIQYFYQENARQAKARNFGIKYSKGELLAFLDSDDLWLPQKLELSLKEFYSGNQDVLFTNAYIFSDNNQLSNLEILRDMKIIPGEYKGDNGLSSFLWQNQVPILTVIAKKEAIIEVVGFNDENKFGTEDYELWLELLANGYVIRGVNITLSLYRIHPNSTTSTNNMNINVVKMFHIFFDKYPEIRNIYKEQIINWLYKCLETASNKIQIYTVFCRSSLKKLSIKINYFILLYLYLRRDTLSLNSHKRILKIQLDKQIKYH